MSPERAADHTDPWPPRLSRLALGAVLALLAVAAVRAVRDGWVPTGDSALIAVRARDVLGGGPQPHLGLWASVSWTVGFDVNHPGPLLYHLLAVPATVIGGAAGMVVGTVAVQAAAVAGIYLAAQRRGGPLLATAAMACTGVLCWSMGSGVLTEAWHATTVLLPFLCFLVLAWSVAAGDLACLPWLALTGSLVLQTNLGYALLVPALAVAAVAALALRWWRSGGDVSRQRTGAYAAATAAVVVVTWALPLREQVAGGGEGNMARLVRSSREDVMTFDVPTALRAVADIAAVPPWFAPPSFAEAFSFTAFGNRLPPLALALVALGALAAALAVALVTARRRGDGVAATALALAALLLAVALVTAVETPAGDEGAVAYQLRWLWPVAAYLLLAGLVAAVRRFATTDGARRWWAGGLAGVTVAAAGLGLPATDHGTSASPDTQPVAQSLVDQVVDAGLDGPLLVVCQEHVYDPYCEAVIAALRDSGVALRVPEGIGVRQLGEARRWDGRSGAARLRVVTGDFATLPAPPDDRRIALHRGLDEDEQEELFYLRSDLEAAAEAGELRLDAGGRRVAARGDLLSVDPDAPDAAIDPGRLTEVREHLLGEHRRDLVAMVREGLLEANPEWDRALARYADLQRAWDEQTVAAFLGPVPAGDPEG